MNGDATFFFLPHLDESQDPSVNTCSNAMGSFTHVSVTKTRASQWMPMLVSFIFTANSYRLCTSRHKGYEENLDFFSLKKSQVKNYDRHYKCLHK